MCQCVGVGGAQYRALCLALDEQCIQVGSQYADCWSLPGLTLFFEVEVRGQGLEPTPVNGKPIRPTAVVGRAICRGPTVPPRQTLCRPS